MIKWKKIMAGEYISADKRFTIAKEYDRIYGMHWVLRDKADGQPYKGKYNYDRLLDCKVKAELILDENKK